MEVLCGPLKRQEFLSDFGNVGLGSLASQGSRRRMGRHFEVFIVRLQRIERGSRQLIGVVEMVWAKMTPEVRAFEILQLRFDPHFCIQHILFLPENIQLGLGPYDLLRFDREFLLRFSDRHSLHSDHHSSHQLLVFHQTLHPILRKPGLHIRRRIGDVVIQPFQLDLVHFVRSQDSHGYMVFLSDLIDMASFRSQKRAAKLKAGGEFQNGDSTDQIERGIPCLAKIRRIPANHHFEIELIDVDRHIELLLDLLHFPSAIVQKERQGEVREIDRFVGLGVLRKHPFDSFRRCIDIRLAPTQLDERLLPARVATDLAVEPLLQFADSGSLLSDQIGNMKRRREFPRS